MLKRLLIHPLGRGVDLDDPQATVLRKQILEQKKFLRHIYEEWYESLARGLPEVDGPVLELGTGAGFLRDRIPGLITSDVLYLPDLDLVMDALHIPLRTASLRAILMIDVLHHLPRTRSFFSEATRCVKPGGVIIMIEPWVTPWSRLVYGRLHHEPFLPDASQWEFPASGPLSGANGALPWIIFERDLELFNKEFPHWRLNGIEPDMPLSYLLSGGVSMRALVPGMVYRPFRWLERRLKPLYATCAMFARIRLERTN